MKVYVLQTIDIDTGEYDLFGVFKKREDAEKSIRKTAKECSWSSCEEGDDYEISQLELE
jgi:hypothetical protein